MTLSDTVRDHALSLACLRRGLVAVQARGYDSLPADTLAGFDATLPASVDRFVSAYGRNIFGSGRP